MSNTVVHTRLSEDTYCIYQHSPTSQSVMRVVLFWWIFTVWIQMVADAMSSCPLPPRPARAMHRCSGSFKQHTCQDGYDYYQYW